MSKVCIHRLHPTTPKPKFYNILQLNNISSLALFLLIRWEIWPLRVLLRGLFRASRSRSLTALICQLSFAIPMLFSILSRPGFLDSSAQFPFIDHFPPLVPLSLVLFPLPLLLLDFSSIFFHPHWKTAIWGSLSASNFKQLYIPTTPGFLWWIPLANIEIMRRN